MEEARRVAADKADFAYNNRPIFCKKNNCDPKQTVAQCYRERATIFHPDKNAKKDIDGRMSALVEQYEHDISDRRTKCSGEIHTSDRE